MTVSSIRVARVRRLPPCTTRWHGQEPGGWPWRTPTGPGDLSRRVAQRRTELKLTLQQVADRAQMSSRFLEYVEQYPAQLTAAALTRLADALETTTAELLGGEAGLPPSSSAGAAQPVTRSLRS